MRFRIEHSRAGYSDPLDDELPIEERKALFELIDSEVFENLKNSGQLRLIGDMRMEIISCYKLIKDCNNLNPSLDFATGHGLHS